MPADPASASRISLQDRLGYHFQSRRLLEQALTHRSYAASNNERLEFLGDAILDLVVGELLFHHYPLAREGELSRMRAGMVCGENLAGMARDLGIGDCLLMGTGEIRSGGRTRQAALANALEAIIAAVYLDGGWSAAFDLVARLFQAHLDAAPEQSKDAKSRLQEWLQARQMPLPTYTLLQRCGEEHAARFRVACDVQALGVTAEAEASNTRKAEQAAAAAVLARLSEQGVIS